MTSNQEQELLAWQGASAVSSLETFNQLWITKQDYSEHGDRIFLQKHF
jgi:actin-related protein